MTATCRASSPTSRAASTTSTGGGEALGRPARRDLRARSRRRSPTGARIIVLSDRHSNAELAPIPSLLLTAAVHHHLVREKTRTQVGLVIEAGDVREVHHVALLIGYGAAAVNPYLAMETVEDLARDGHFVDIEPEKARSRNLVKALGKGVLKVMSKMGVSTVASYTGAQIFEAVGLSQDARRPATSPAPRQQARRHRARHHRRGGRPPPRARPTRSTACRRRTARSRSAASTSGAARASRTCSTPRRSSGCSTPPAPGATTSSSSTPPRVDEQSERLMTLRGLFRFKDADALGRTPVPIDEVEPVSEIVKRFSTGAMSYGSISQEAHETLAIAMNRLGGKSNTGEGGEDADRLYDPERRSVDQAGRLRPLRRDRRSTSPTPTTSRSRWRRARSPARAASCPATRSTRGWPRPGYSTPGVGLISPPPHHDIYSIEDLAQLIHDLKNANPSRADPREARRRGRRRHGRRRRLQGARRRRPDLRPRRRHRRLAADLAQARRRALGARPRRDPADAAAQRPARPDRRAVRRPAQDRPRRRHRRAARAPRSSASPPRRWWSRAAS